MREELHGELVEKHAEEWRPQRYGWLNPANSPASRAALDKAITICVTKGRSVRTTHRLTKPRASIGKIGGGADMQIDDPEVCPLHCAVAITENGVRLYDLDSVNGTMILDLIQSIHESQRPTVVMATHSERAAAYGDYVIRLSDGQIEN